MKTLNKLSDDRTNKKKRDLDHVPHDGENHIKTLQQKNSAHMCVWNASTIISFLTNK